MKTGLSAKASEIKRQTSLTSSSPSYPDGVQTDASACSAKTRETLVHHGKMRSLSTDRSGMVTILDQQSIDVIFCIAADAVHAVTDNQNSVVFQARYVTIKEIVWDYNDKSVRFVLKDGSCLAQFIFTTLSEVEEHLTIVLRNSNLQQHLEQTYMGVLIGKSIPTPIQQHRLFGSAGGSNGQHIAILPAFKRRQLLQQERPIPNSLSREQLAIEYIRQGFLTFTCSINGDLRGLKLDLRYISVFPSPDYHDRSACLFAYCYDNIETCESMGTRLELRFARCGSKQPTYIAFQSLEAQHIRDSIWYFTHGAYTDIGICDTLQDIPNSHLSNDHRRQCQPKASRTMNRSSMLKYFRDSESLQLRIDLRCHVVGCLNRVDTNIGFSGTKRDEESTEKSTYDNVLRHSASLPAVATTAHAGMNRCCAKHKYVLSPSRSSSKRFLMREKTKSSQSITTFVQTDHYLQIVKYQGQLLKMKSSGKYYLKKAWSMKYVALFETPVGEFLCYYDKLSHCPGKTETPKERRVIDMCSVIGIRAESSFTNVPATFAFDVLTVYRNWTFATNDPEEYEAWIHILRNAVEQHTSATPDKPIKVAVKVLLTDQSSHHHFTRNESAILEISSQGVTVYAAHDREVGVYNWYFTEIQKWSVAMQQGELCCLLSCQSTASSTESSLNGDRESIVSPSYHEFLFQTAEASRICHTIEFFVGKCMAKLETLSTAIISTHATSSRVEKESHITVTTELSQFRNEHVVCESSNQNLLLKRSAAAPKLDSLHVNQDLVTSINLQPIIPSLTTSNSIMKVELSVTSVDMPVPALLKPIPHAAIPTSLSISPSTLPKNNPAEAYLSMNKEHFGRPASHSIDMIEELDAHQINGVTFQSDQKHFFPENESIVSNTTNSQESVIHLVEGEDLTIGDNIKEAEAEQPYFEHCQEAKMSVQRIHNEINANYALASEKTMDLQHASDEVLVEPGDDEMNSTPRATLDSPSRSLLVENDIEYTLARDSPVPLLKLLPDKGLTRPSLSPVPTSIRPSGGEATVSSCSAVLIMEIPSDVPLELPDSSPAPLLSSPLYWELPTNSINTNSEDDEIDRFESFGNFDCEIDIIPVNECTDLDNGSVTNATMSSSNYDTTLTERLLTDSAEDVYEDAVSSVIADVSEADRDFDGVESENDSTFSRISAIVNEVETITVLGESAHCSLEKASHEDEMLHHDNGLTSVSVGETAIYSGDIGNNSRQIWSNVPESKPSCISEKGENDQQQHTMHIMRDQDNGVDCSIFSHLIETIDGRAD